MKSSSSLIGPVETAHRAESGAYFGKRLFDGVLVVLALPFLLPLIGALAFLVASDGHAPFFLQHRIGRGGKPFHIIKLRTMVPDADARLAAQLSANPGRREEWERFQKLSHDPRVTRIGAVLRRSSLDELPQLLNVLLGDMSLVGPRPMLPEQADLYPGQAYYRMRPGITGPWQVSERNAVGFAERATYDNAYLESQSLAGDIGYLVRTVAVVTRMSGC